MIFNELPIGAWFTFATDAHKRQWKKVSRTQYTDLVETLTITLKGQRQVCPIDPAD